MSFLKLSAPTVLCTHNVDLLSAYLVMGHCNCKQFSFLPVAIPPFLMNSLEKKAFLKVISELHYKRFVYMTENFNESCSALTYTRPQCPVCLNALALTMAPYNHGLCCQVDIFPPLFFQRFPWMSAPIQVGLVGFW